MIKNERQYKITKSQLDKFSKAIKDLEIKENKIGSSSLLKLQKASLESHLNDLQREIAEYTDLKSGMIPIAELHSIDELPQTLIKARISLGLSQKELGKLIGLPEQQIQRYESTEYESASISRIKEIADALDLKTEKQFVIPSNKFSLSKLFKKTSEVGIDKEFLMKRLLPPRLAARFEEQDVVHDLLGYQAAFHIGKIFGIPPSQIFESEPLVLNTAPIAQVRYKIPSNANEKKLSAYTIYAHYVALLVSQATRHKTPKSIPDDPFTVRNEIISSYGNITFETILRYTWNHGIPVLALDPTSFHAACFHDDDRNIIVLTQKTDSESRWMFNLLHELYHASQGQEQVAESIDEIRNPQIEEERIASQFADIVLLGQDPHPLAEKCLEMSSGSASLIKDSLLKIASEENVRADVLANYLAFRLSLEQRQNLWGTATVLQKPLPTARRIIRDQLIENLDFSILSESDLDLLRQTLFVEEATING